MQESNEYLGGRTREQDEAADDVEPATDSGVRSHQSADVSDPAPPADGASGERTRQPSGGL